jgi:hypothetical protein
VKRLLIATVTFLFTAIAFATTIVPVSVEDLTASASRVIEGQAVSTWTSWDASHRVLVTYTRFAVSKSLKGAATKEVVVQQLGGTDGVLTQKVAGIRHFQVGESDVLFLRPGDAADDPLVVVGLIQGNFRVMTTSTGQKVATNGVAGVHALTASGVTEYEGSQIPLTELESRIRKVVGQ